PGAAVQELLAPSIAAGDRPDERQGRAVDGRYRGIGRQHSGTVVAVDDVEWQLDRGQSVAAVVRSRNAVSLAERRGIECHTEPGLRDLDSAEQPAQRLPAVALSH